MASVGVHEAKTHLSRLLQRVRAGEEIVITSNDEPLAKLVPIGQAGPRQIGIDDGRYEVPADFDAALPSDLLDAFDA